MRADMFKVIVERPRWGSRHARAAKLKRDRNVDRKGVGLKRHAWECTGCTKGLNENLAPLVRYLHRQVGRRWDDVFSEICVHLDTGNTVKMHVRQHLRDFVRFGIGRGRNGELIHEGRVLDPAADRRWRRWALYVDPDDGVLKDHAGFWRARGKAVRR